MYLNQLNQTMECLEHICTEGCSSVGPYDMEPSKNKGPCSKFSFCEGLQQSIKHIATCKRRVNGGCIRCKRMWQLLKLHSSSVTNLISAEFPCAGKSASLSHDYYGNPTFGLGMSYPGSLLVGALLPNYPIGSGSPIRHGDRSLRFPSGIRNLNLAGGLMGSWHSETGGTLDENFASSILDMSLRTTKPSVFSFQKLQVILLSSAWISMEVDLFSRNLKLPLPKRKTWFLMILCLKLFH